MAFSDQKEALNNNSNVYILCIFEFLYLAPGSGDAAVDESDVRVGDRVLLLVEHVVANVDGNGDEAGGHHDAEDAEAQQPARSLQTVAQVGRGAGGASPRVEDCAQLALFQQTQAGLH